MSPTLVEAADTPVEAFKLNEFNSNVTSNVTQTPKTVDTSNSLPSPSLSPDNYHDEVMGGSISLDNRMDTIESVGKHEVFGDNDEENDADNDDDDNDHNNVNSDNENVNYVDNDGLVKRNEEMVKMKQSKKNKHYKKLTKDVHDAIDEYKVMLDQLPILSKQLLFYILDLLAMVQNHSSENLMSSRNLAAIFQPSILSHPNHDLDPTEYALSQFVVEFLIQYAYKLLPNHDNLSRPISKSPVSTTSVNKLEGDKHKLAPRFNRQHSKSLSSANHEDVVGYQNKVSNSKLPVVDKDYEIAEDDSDHEEKEKFKEREPSSQPAIIVSTPSSSSVPKV
ncbi:hypothetical protein CANTEDRAFT_95755 [Yamadazyma tenuis ATCC 10573]|nr:uncharacterized protein CANTEDRAFT_95755 [Yamadazyma tenuis ATCC 10573]EGV60305.1 hypothetical protein CANTEDRAFT_95755 [Yamadazyma tenuis ATCC 10573]